MEAALAVIDEHGLSGFGLAAVAQRLGVKAPSLYHHFASKEDLLSEVSLALLIEGELPPFEPDPDWIEQIVRISTSSWRSVLRHPKAATLLLQYMPTSLLMGAYEHWAHYLAVNGVPSRLHIIILDGTDKLTFGSVLFTAQRWIEGSGGMKVAKTERLPYLSEASAAMTMNDEEQFSRSIRDYVRGVLAGDSESGTQALGKAQQDALAGVDQRKRVRRAR